MSEKSGKRSKAYRTSATVALILAVLTVIEYFIAINMDSAVLLMLIALLKAVAVMNYFMHISRLWTQEGEH
ncbi:MAG: cytochrome C oxidase subunit IV family protein [Caldilineaceae bacterium]|nr:cytochrome C oxidase subunit IV family protein [Caldilineaceae bacterium]